MPSVFLNIPTNLSTVFNSKQIASLRERIANAANVSADKVKIFVQKTDQAELLDNGRLKQSGCVEGYVVWFGGEERNLLAKQIVANALQHFLNIHSTGKGFNLTFFDMPGGSFFHEKNGKSVQIVGGEYIPSPAAIAQAVYEATGYESPGIIPSDW